MPHCIIEFSQPLLKQTSAIELTQTVHQAVIKSSLFDNTHIKSRAIPYEHFLVGDSTSDFLHVMLRIHSGRSTEQKKSLSSIVLEHLNELRLSNTVITIEVIEMDKSCYAKSDIIV